MSKCTLPKRLDRSVPKSGRTFVLIHSLDKFDPKIDEDNPQLDAVFMAGINLSRRRRPKLDSPKVEVKIRLDAKTVEHLRGSGPGWQTRVNALLGKLVADGRI